ncbi:MAG TPA: ABC transporter permease, partial [Lysobacter sp.]|nr:ABC transporter permease [Lysobacter sp.]
QHWFKFNPIYPLVVSYQNVLVFGKSPLWTDLGWLALVAAGMWLIALLIFRRSSAEMVDSL